MHRSGQFGDEVTNMSETLDFAGKSADRAVGVNGRRHGGPSTISSRLSTFLVGGSRVRYHRRNVTPTFVAFARTSTSGNSGVS